MKLFNTDWMDDALCRRAPTLEWTEVTRNIPNPRSMRPSNATISALAQVCLRCPVRRDCAQYALDSESQCGMWAGVWIPATGTSHVSPTWREARQALRRLLTILKESA